MADSDFSSFLAIRTRFRQLARVLTTKHLSNIDANKFINNFILNKFPAHIISGIYEDLFTFYTVPNQDIYETSTSATSRLYNFKNVYRNISAPVYVSGVNSQLVQSISEFYGLYPRSYKKIAVKTGDGVTTNFTGTLSYVPLLKNEVYFSSIDTAGDRLLATESGGGTWEGSVSAPGSINYITGAYNITFDIAPANGESIYANQVQYTAGRPNTVLFYSSKIYMRPVPDKIYKIDIVTKRRPDEMLNDSDVSGLTEFADYISYGAAIDHLYVKHDTDTVEKLIPKFNSEELLIKRRTAVQTSTKTARTIFNSSYESNGRYWD